MKYEGQHPQDIKGKMSNDLPIIEVEVPNLEDAIVTQANSQHHHSNPNMTSESATKPPTQSNKKMRKRMRPRSEVWDHFIKFVTKSGEIKGFNDESKVKCSQGFIESLYFKEG
ncbi:uncharacterized protein LOC131157089 [Malania oleifera]|uniref:uncharacterized protein LOC131157089 n=1 Tax=Malania oleifera TaxID=397392 RepID=UPI0025AE901C|nr:uncharacterized protein LOC131157089 [Malania oleifera]